VCTLYAGASGNVLINENVDRLSTYTVWDYAEGKDSYYSSMSVDLTQPPSKVSDLYYFHSLTDVSNVLEVDILKSKSKTSVIRVIRSDCQLVTH